MKLFRVLFDIDMPRDENKDTPIRREERYYAAANANDVWEAIKIDRIDESMTFIALIEHAPGIIVLNRERTE